MTLDYAEIDLARCFDDGMAYVALSRVISLQNTRILSFDPAKVTANRKVETFYRDLEAQCPQPPARAEGDSGGGGAAADDGFQQGDGNGGGGGGGAGRELTEEQKQRIAANKAAALARAKAKKDAAAAAASAKDLCWEDWEKVTAAVATNVTVILISHPHVFLFE